MHGKVNRDPGSKEFAKRVARALSDLKAKRDAIYEYIERLQVSNGVTMEAHRYYFTIRDQKVIHKQMWTINQPAYDLNNDISDL